VLVSDRHILTCAHVVAVTDTNEHWAEIRVQLVGMPGQPTITAHVRDGCWQPERPNDHCADVALLELEDAVRDVTPARLRQMRLIDLAVQAQGYPRGNSADAEWARTVVVGPTGPDSEWMEMNPRQPTSAPVRHGFSGAGVVDPNSGDVVGLVIAKQSDRASRSSYMISVEKIARHLPDIEQWIVGGPSTDAVFMSTGEERISQLTGSDLPTNTDNGVTRTVRALVAGLADGGGVVWNVVGPAEDRMAVLGIMVVLADPTSRQRAPRSGPMVPADLVLPAGRIDLALDARGRTTREMAGRVLERLGLPTDQPDAVEQAVVAGAALTMVIDSLEDAVDPQVLQRDLVEPIAKAVPEQGGRLIVGSRQAVLAGHGGTALPVGADPALTVGRQLDELLSVDAEVNALVHLSYERHTNDGAPKFRSAPVVQNPDELRVTISALRDASRAQYDDPRMPGILASLRRVADRALRRAGSAFDQLDAMLRDRERMRGSLHSYRAGPAEVGHAEDPQLSRLYETAYQQLYTEPCDLITARAAVDAYLHGVRRLLGSEDEDGS
jgi:hypothetical protein